MALIALTRGKVAIVDDEDYEALSQWKWTYFECGYACRNIRNRKEGWQKKIYMHHQVIGRSTNKHVDHINGNKLDNRKSNLRFATQHENMCNTGIRANNKSGYKGVSWHKQVNKWTVRIRTDTNYASLGLFDDKIEAAKAYDRAARHHYGEFARLNFPNPNR